MNRAEIMTRARTISIAPDSREFDEAVRQYAIGVQSELARRTTIQLGPGIFRFGGITFEGAVMPPLPSLRIPCFNIARRFNSEPMMQLDRGSSRSGLFQITKFGSCEKPWPKAIDFDPEKFAKFEQ